MLSSFVGTAVYPLAGDFNRDGVVDMRDYVVWRDYLGKNVLGYSGADGDGNGVVDANDYSVWRANYGVGSGSGTSVVAAVPEPAAACLLIALLIFSGTCRCMPRRTNLL
jgi:hypothetical protein